MLDINDIKKSGTVLKIDGQPYVVLEAKHAHTGRGRANVQTKLRNLITGAVVNQTFNAGDKAEEAEIEKIKASFLYQDDNNIYLMDAVDYEQHSLVKNLLDGKEKYLRDGQEATVLFFDQKPFNIELPKKIDLKVIDALPGVRGDSATNIMKQITLETGLKINAPLFIKPGDLVRINTETGEYVERA